MDSELHNMAQNPNNGSAAPDEYITVEHDHTTESEPETYRFEKLHKQLSTPVSIIMITATLVALAIVIIITISEKGIDESTLNRFWTNQCVKYVSIGVIQFICGLAVRYKDLKVNYSRKIVHVCYFMIPQVLDTELLEFEKNVYTELWNIVIIFLLLLVMLEIVRKRLWIFGIMYSAIDRPEDRPYTTFWFMTQLMVSIPIIACFSVLFSHLGKENFIFIPLIILTLGDGLAEPVGTRFGYHKYKVKGLFVKEEYTRSIQGSLCVTFFSIVSVLIYYNDFTKASITFSLLVLPIVMTLTEAKSPHTWDNPILLLVGNSLMVAAYYIGEN